MASNGFSLALGNADVDFSDGVETHGFKCLNGTTITEQRGTGFAAASGTGGTVYQDAEPFSRQVWENFQGGFGQAQQDKQFGGQGIGGTPDKFYDSTGWTLKGNILLPGMARNMISPTSPTSRISDAVEVPRGVLPLTHPYACYTQITPAGGNITFDQVRVLVKFASPAAILPFDLVLTIYLANTLIGTFSNTFATTASTNTTEYKWHTLTRTAGALTLTSGVTYNIFGIADDVHGIVWGGFVGTLDTSAGTIDNIMQPYLQIINTSTGRSYRDWADEIRQVEQLLNGSTYFPVAITDTDFFLPDTPATAPRGLAGAFVRSYVFDNKLYISTSGATSTNAWTAAPAAAAGAASFTDGTFIMGPATTHGGNIFFVDYTNTSKGAIVKWDGIYPATAGANFNTVILPDKIGSASTTGMNNINNLVLHKGWLFLFKPEGVFWIYSDPALITTAEIPRVNQPVNLTDQQHQDNGKWVCEMQGMLYFNVRNQVYQLTVSETSGNQVTVLVPPLLMGKFNTYNYVNGLATNGDTLFISYANLGIKAWKAGTWHTITDYYDRISGDGERSGLRYLASTSGGTDSLFAGDARQLLRIPIPNLNGDFSTQFFMDSQNKCFYHITSIFDGDLAEMRKYLRSFILRAFSSGLWRFKLVAAFWQPGTPPIGYRQIIEKTLHNGLIRDRWLSPQAPSTVNGTIPVVVKRILDGSGNPTTTPCPCFWEIASFDNSYASAERFCSDDDVGHPVQGVNIAYILYGWSTFNTNDSAYSGLDIAYVESIVHKYLPVQNYLPIYQMRIDLDSLAYGGALQLSQAQLSATQTWLRSRIGATTPTRMSFKDMTGATKTVIGFIQNPTSETDPQTVNDNAPTGAKIMSLRFLSVEDEYTS